MDTWTWQKKTIARHIEQTVITDPWSSRLRYSGRDFPLNLAPARSDSRRRGGGHLSWMDDNVEAFLICYVFWHKRNHLTANIDFGVPESTQNNPQRNRIAEWNLCYRMGGSSDYMVSAPRAMHPKTNPGKSLQKVFFRGMAATNASHDQNLVAKLMLPWGWSTKA